MDQVRSSLEFSPWLPTVHSSFCQYASLQGGVRKVVVSFVEVVSFNSDLYSKVCSPLPQLSRLAFVHLVDDLKLPVVVTATFS